MPSKRTSNYQLSQWEPEDKVLRTDFNEDNKKIDTALKNLNTSLAGKASTSDLNSLQTTVNGKASTSALNSLQSTVTSLQSTLSALQTTVAGKQDTSAALKLAVGRYVGNTASVSGGVTSGSQTITLSFKPKAVLVMPEGGDLYNNNAGGYVYGGLAVTGYPGRFKDNTTVELTSSGFTVHTYYGSNIYGTVHLNDKDKNYHYIAIG